MDFPRFVYFAPGQYRHSCGGRYGYVVVHSQAEYDDHLARGHFAHPRDAIADAGEPAFMVGLNKSQTRYMQKARPWESMKPAPSPEPAPAPAPEPEPDPIPDDDAPPTREEMLAKAALLGLRVDRRWSDERLMARIAEIMAAPASTSEDPI